jgi:hypothetical protein
LYVACNRTVAVVDGLSMEIMVRKNIIRSV